MNTFQLVVCGLFLLYLNVNSKIDVSSTFRSNFLYFFRPFIAIYIFLVDIKNVLYKIFQKPFFYKYLLAIIIVPKLVSL